MTPLTSFQRDSMYLGRLIALMITALIWFVWWREMKLGYQMGYAFVSYVLTVTVSAAVVHAVRLKRRKKNQILQLPDSTDVE